ncbi:MAG: polysaccharide deacetylase family protein, partial [Gemmatimonadetes bacterium]|nr:polysaccharide deacetylase family protein [Gemmatimonadota bacterium]
VPSPMYHYIDWLPPYADRFRVDLTVSPTDFEEHVKYLRANGYTAVTASEIWWTLDQGGPLPQRPVSLTFDDGTVGQYHYAYKILKKYGMIGTFYVTTNLVGRDGYITRAMLKEMVDGGMDIQSHAVDHVSMLTADQTYQMCTSRRILSEWTGKDVRHFAYPAGDYNAAAFASLSRCGYLSAFWKAGGSLQSSDRMFLLYRERVRGQQGLAALLGVLSR